MEEPLKDLVRRVVGGLMAERGRARHPGSTPADTRLAGVHVDIAPCDGADRPGADSACAAPEPDGSDQLVTARCLERTPSGGSHYVARGATLTALAEEEAWRRGIRIVRGHAPVAGERSADAVLRVAVASDHGGFAMKELVLAWVRECGHRPVDFGTRDENPVDYPDQAHAVARAVAEGRCDLGICVDGAGIGSSMAANKVPGVRAAVCWNEATARNAREHNFANVLCLGGRMLADLDAHAVVRAFLATPTGAERHARRVDKITAIEASYAARGSRTQT